MAVPDGSATVTAAGVAVRPRVSSSVIVPSAAPSPAVVETVALVGEPSVTVMVSLSSSRSSPRIAMATSALVWPAAMVADSGDGFV